MNIDETKTNINIYHSTWHANNVIGPDRPFVCLLCDRFILPRSYQLLTLSQLLKYQRFFFKEPSYNISENLANCYRITLPPISIPDSVQSHLNINDLLLSPRSAYIHTTNNDQGFTVCESCYVSLTSGYRPKYAIANNYCFGSPPECLLNLTDVELSMITPVKTYGYVFSYTGGQRLQLKGTLKYYRINKESLVCSIANLEAIHANVVILLHGDLTNKQYQIAREKNKLRIRELRIAIDWLKLNNAEWINVNVSVENIVSKLQNPNIISDYKLVEDDDIDMETNEMFTVIYPDGNTSTNTGGQDRIETLTKLVHQAAKNKHDLTYKCNLLKESVADYKDNNLINACLLQFPYGRGGMHESRLTGTDKNTTTVNLQEYIKYLSFNSQPQFHTGLFDLILYVMKVKHIGVQTARWKVRNNASASVLATEITIEDVEEAIKDARIARGSMSPETYRGRQLLNAIDAICRFTPHSNEAAKAARRNAEAIQHHFGCPTLFLTVTPDDDNNYSIQILANEKIDNETNVMYMTDEELTMKASSRTKLRLKYPGICALFFEIALQTIIIEVLGWNIKTKKQEKSGLFGKIDAFSITIEEQGRGSLHAHILIWNLELNDKREELHNDRKCKRAETSITEVIDKVSSTRCFFNEAVQLPNRNRKRFIHECTGDSYSLPKFPDDNELRLLRTNRYAEAKMICCEKCKTTFNKNDLSESYLTKFVKVPGMVTYPDTKIRRLKAMAIEYQRRNELIAIPNYICDFGYNNHCHTSSCFKPTKNANIKHKKVEETECRFRIPQKKRPKTIIQNITKEKIVWLKWNGEPEYRHIKEVCLKREEYDAYQNVYCPSITYSKMTCNTNILFLMPGEVAQYCFCYSTKGTQHDDTLAYENLKNAIEKILSEMKYREDERREAIRRILYGSFLHQKDFVCGSTMASYLTRNSERFIFSHNFIWCPIKYIKMLLEEQTVPATVTFNENKANLHCSALNYLCRPSSLSSLNAYDFYALYETTKITTKAVALFGAEPFIMTEWFCHPSYSHNQEECIYGCKMREQPYLIKVNQYDFVDTACFNTNIEQVEELNITEHMENYSQQVLLLFLPYRTKTDMKLNNTYTAKLQYAIQNEIITEKHKKFLQNIQDCKYNSRRCKIKNDDLNRTTEPFHDPIGIENNGITVNVEEHANDILHQVDIIDLFGIIPMETDFENNYDSDTFNMERNKLYFNLEILRTKGTCKNGISSLPDLSQHPHIYDNQLSSNDIIESRYITNTETVTIANKPIAITVTKVDIMTLFINHQNRTIKTFEEITGSTTPIAVLEANGSAQSIVDWALKCRLDNEQKSAFEIICGYYILSYIYSAALSTENNENAFYNNEVRKLEKLVRKNYIKSKQLIIFLHGPGGSGKSTIINLLRLYSNEYHILLKKTDNHRSIVVTAMTGVAATLIGGETTHSSLYLSVNKKKKKKIDHTKIDLWTNTKILIIDEISFATPENIKELEENLRQLKDNCSEVYGGIHIIFCGDMRQLEPVKGVPLYRKDRFHSRIFNHHINCYIELYGMHRYQNDPEWGNLLFRFRNGNPTPDDIYTINSRTIKNSEKKRYNLPPDIKYVTYTNSDRDAINTELFYNRLQYQYEQTLTTKNFILIFADKIEYNKNGVFTPLIAKRYFYENCGESNLESNRNSRIDPVLKLYIGCNIMLTENTDVSSGLANGAQATVQKIKLKEGCQYSTVIVGDDENKIEIRAIFASDTEYIQCKHNNPNIINELFTIKPKSISFKANVPIPPDLRKNNINKHTKYDMRATQIPFIVNNATTGHKLQGSSVNNLYIHTWHHSKNWPYVVLSRVRNLSGLFLRRLLHRDLKRYKVAPDLSEMISELKERTPQDINYDDILN